MREYYSAAKRGQGYVRVRMKALEGMRRGVLGVACESPRESARESVRGRARKKGSGKRARERVRDGEHT